MANEASAALKLVRITFPMDVRSILRLFGIEGYPEYGAQEIHWACKLPDGSIRRVSATDMERLMNAFIDQLLKAGEARRG